MFRMPKNKIPKKERREKRRHFNLAKGVDYVTACRLVYVCLLLVFGREIKPHGCWRSEENETDTEFWFRKRKRNEGVAMRKL